MKSGLGDRNNQGDVELTVARQLGLNEVRSWRPEQCGNAQLTKFVNSIVSMKSGLGDRNNLTMYTRETLEALGLNEVRSWRPEQFSENQLLMLTKCLSQ